MLLIRVAGRMTTVRSTARTLTPEAVTHRGKLWVAEAPFSWRAATPGTSWDPRVIAADGESYTDAGGAAVPGLDGRDRPFPVEYKRGKPKVDVCDEVQLCAQALCLEEMLGTSIANGALFYGRPRRRKEVELTEVLRQQTRETAGKLHELLRSGQTPKAAYAKKCESCSLLERCLPRITGIKKNIRHYLSQAGMDE